MLSYRHSYHAGNHADVLKHSILIQLLQHLRLKEKAFWVIDTHAGAGSYALDSDHAQKLAEFREGIARLWELEDLPPMCSAYIDEIKSFNPNGALLSYPGSPWLAHRALRSQDRLRLFELHSSDFRLLDASLGNTGNQTIAYADDGFAKLKALLPPPSRRALVLIDPSYELREDYTRLLTTLQDALGRFPTGTYAIWYPMLNKPESKQLPHKLKALGVENWLHASLSVRSPSPDGFGMHGSGMFIINPPWTLAKTLSAELPWLCKILAQDPGNSFQIEHQTN